MLGHLPYRRTGRWSAAVLLACVVVSSVAAQDEFEKRTSWQVPAVSEVRQQVTAWAEERKLDELNRLKVEALWPEGEEQLEGSAVLQRLCDTAALVDERARAIVELCSGPPKSPVLPKVELEVGDSLNPWFQANLQLLYGRWLAQHRYYDEALATLASLQVEQVVDPATLLFYQSAGHHRMLDKEQCLPVLDKLLEREDELPRRYATVARLMRADLEPLKPDSLDEVARLMDEIRRRLDMYQAGTKVRKQESDVIAKLDKMIEELEKQQQQQSGGAGGGSSRSSNPAQDSNIMGGYGPGEVDKKHIGNKSGWGNLPPKERQEALQQIGKDLPSHYREVIEGYFRKLANESR